MQKAVMVRAELGDAVGSGWSFEVDGASDSCSNPLRELLQQGWRVAHLCPMTAELDGCCLVILEEPVASKLPPAVHVEPEVCTSATDSEAPAVWESEPVLNKSGDGWDGETIPLAAFGLVGS